MEIDGAPLVGVALEDIVRSRRAARRPRDLAVLEILERPLRKPRSRRTRLAAIRRESERIVIELIRRRLALPPERLQTHRPIHRPPTTNH
jgi:hypothetical protein